MSNVWQKVIDHTLWWETGGRADGAPGVRPHDSGGFTKWGVAQRWHPEVDVENLTRSGAEEFYFKKFWHAPKIYQLPVPVCMGVFDHGVTSNPNDGIRVMQIVLGVKADGHIGPKTLAAVARWNSRELAREVGMGRISFYITLARSVKPAQMPNLDGWCRRAGDTMFLMGEHA